MRHNYRDRALVVRHYDFSEADRVIVLLTREHGIVRSVAKGVRKTKSRFGGRVSPFVVLDVQLYAGRSNLASLTGADTVASYNQLIVDSYPAYTAACTVLSIAENLAHGDPSPELFDLTVAAVAAIAHGVSSGDSAAGDEAVPAPPDLPDLLESPALPLTSLVDKYALQATRLAGWEPQLFNCARCGAPGPHHAFSASSGGAVCGACRPPGALTVPEESLRLAWWLLNNRDLAVAEAKRDPRFSEISARCHEVVLAHVQWHLGVQIRAAELMESEQSE